MEGVSNDSNKGGQEERVSCKWTSFSEKYFPEKRGYLQVILSFIFIHFILNFLFTVASSAKGGCFLGGRGEIPNYNDTKRRIKIRLNRKLRTFQSSFKSRQRGG